MGFFPFFPLLPTATAILTQIAGGTLPGALTMTGLLTTQLGITNSGAAITSSQQINTTAAQSVQASGNLISQVGSVDVQTAGAGLKVNEGANGKQGTFVLSGAATTVVANTSVTASSRIILTCQALGTVASASTLAVSSRSVGVSFTVTPSQATDTSTIAFEIFEPG